MGKGRGAQGLLNFLVWWGYLVTTLCFIPYRWNSYFQKYITSFCLFGEACWAWFNLFRLRWEFWKGFGFIFQIAGANCRKTESVEIQNIGYLPGVLLISWKWIVLFYHSFQNAGWRLFSSSKASFPICLSLHLLREEPCWASVPSFLSWPPAMKNTPVPVGAGGLALLLEIPFCAALITPSVHFTSYF